MVNIERHTHWLPSELIEGIVGGFLCGVAKKDIGRCVVVQLLVR